MNIKNNGRYSTVQEASFDFFSTDNIFYTVGSADVSSLGTPPAYYSPSQSETEEGSDQLISQPPTEAQLITKPNQTTETTVQAAIEVVNEAPQPAKPRKTYKKMKKPSDNQ